jgi:membrane fusion protein, multidrug efflux system
MRHVSVTVIAGLLVSCGAKEEPAPPIRPVRTETVTAAGATRVRRLAGTAQADVESNLSFRVGGNVRRVLVVTGDRIREGQLMAELDPTDLQLQVQEAEAALVQARAGARQADSEYERAQGLYENRNASRSDLDAARAAAESARAQIEAAVQRLELARSQLSYARLLAPAAGSIASVDVERNENVKPGQTVALLTSGSKPEVSVAVPESLIGQVRKGSGVSVAFDALPGRGFPALVTKVGVAATGMGTTYPVTVQLRDAAPDVRSGMAAEVAFTFAAGGGEGERYLVPPHAVLEDREGRFVFVVEPGGSSRGTVRRRGVRVGELTGEGLEIREGLKGGELLVTAGGSQIHDGLEVKLLPGAAARP